MPAATPSCRPGDVLGSGTVGTGCILELTPEAVGGWLKPGDVVELDNRADRNTHEPDCREAGMTDAENWRDLAATRFATGGTEVERLRNLEAIVKWAARRGLFPSPGSTCCNRTSTATTCSCPCRTAAGWC